MQHSAFNKFISQFVRLAIFVIVFSVAYSASAQAASLYISPNSAKVSAGNIVSVRVLVSTAGKAINNVESKVLFPSDILEVLSISKSSSIFSLWVEEPKFSNPEGSITFNGGVPSPGYTGDAGEVVSITFKAKKQGTATIAFSDSAVRQNDGLGTDILTAKSQSVIEVAGVAEPEVEQVVPSEGAPAAPVVVSTTQPEQNKWYSNSKIELRWDVPADATSVATLLGKNPSAIPATASDISRNTRSVPDTEDGVWYFHIRFKNKNGWGAVTHFKIQIDTVAPLPFKLAVLPAASADDPRPVLAFTATDALSGIDHYEIKVDGGEYKRVSTQEIIDGKYTVAAQEPGSHNLIVKAIDLANNVTVQTLDFTVSSIDVPRINTYQSKVAEGGEVYIGGTALPLTMIEGIIEDSSGVRTSQTARSQDDGKFMIIWAKTLPKGSYTMMVRSIDDRGAKSLFSTPVNFTVGSSALSTLSSFVLNWLSLIIILILVVGLIVLILYYFVHRALRIRGSVGRSVKLAETSAGLAFDLLRKNVKEHIKNLEKTKNKRALTKEETKLITHLQKNLLEAEEVLEKEIADIDDIIS